jgi:hypothetical protein
MKVSTRIFTASAALAALVLVAAWDDPGFWVIKDSRLPTCSIVTRNPVVDGPILWSSGPYRSKVDAELAMKTISACN